MDSYTFVDNIQLEKANAVARYKTSNNIAKSFRLLELFFVVALLSWSSSCLPTGFKISGDYFFAFSCSTINQHLVFLLGNLIIFLCYFLSRNQSDDHDHSLQVLQNSNKTIEVNPNVEEKVFVNETVATNETGYEVVDDMVEKTAGEDAIKKAAKQIERFQRTQSAKLKREMSMKPCRELRRAVTDGRNTAVEKLSNEEFRLAVEAFILKQQSFLKQQSTVVD